MGNCTYPFDITGYQIEMQVKTALNSANPPLIDVSTANGNILVDGPNGKINIYIPNAITSGLILGSFFYDLRVTNTVGLIERLFGGRFNVKEMVTQ